MASKPTDDLTIAAVRLRGAAPREWAAFMSAVAAYASEQRDICVQSPTDVLQVNQGRAQNAAAFLKLLTDAPTLAARIEDKRRV